MRLSEEKLRARIRNAFSAASKGRSIKSAGIIEEQLLDLMHEYAAAPKGQRDAVYLRGEKRILQTARKLRFLE